MKKFLLLCILAVTSAFAQYSPPITVTGGGGGGSGTVTSVAIAGTANQITATGTCSGTVTISCTLSIPSAFVLPGTIDGLTITTTTGTFTLTNAKTFAVGNSITLTGTDSDTYNFPAAGSVTNNDCAKLTVSGSTVGITDAGGICAVLGANNFTGIQNITVIPGANTIADGVEVYNITSATAGNQQYSPAIHLQGQGFATSGSTSDSVDYRMYVLPIQAATPTASFQLQASINGGAFATVLACGSIGSCIVNNATNPAIAGGFQAASLIASTALYLGNTSGSTVAGSSTNTIRLTPGSGTLVVSLGGATSSFPAFTVTSQVNPILQLIDAAAGTTAQLQVAGTLASGTGDVNLCWKTTGIFTQGSVCGTSLAKYKDNIQTITHGLDYVMKMHPVTFNWKSTGSSDLGMIADEVAAIDPIFGAYDSTGVLYNFRDRVVLSTLVKAVQELESKIQTLKQ